jgi:hypothetical protein
MRQFIHKLMGWYAESRPIVEFANMNGPILGIETALELAGSAFSDKYRLMKDRLIHTEYEHWAAGFPEGNNHGRGHITRVLERLNQLLGSAPLEHLNAYELFLTMMAILYHDIGMLRERKEHAEISKALLEGDSHDAYIINAIDKQIIASAVVSHSSSKDIAQECRAFSPVEYVGRYSARPHVIAALVRLADELDEDHLRADPILQNRLNLPEESRFFWLFCQRVRGIRPDLVSKRIDVNLALEPSDTSTYGPMPGGRKRHFVAFVAEKLAKINKERVTVNRFLPPELQYTGLHIDVKPLRGHPTWMAPRTFVFNDQTTSDMFLHSFPELLQEPSRAALQRILESIRNRDFDNAEHELGQLASVREDLPIDVQIAIPYEQACVQSLRAEACTANSAEREASLDAAASHLVEWYRQGSDNGWSAMGRTESAEIHRMASDGDLALVSIERKEKLRDTIPSQYWPTPRSGGGCVPIGTVIDTPHGPRRVEELRAGDEILSVRLSAKPEHVKAKVAAIVTSRNARCIRLNNVWSITPGQPLRTSNGWVRADALRPGDSVMDRHCAIVAITDVMTIEGYFEIFDVTVDDTCHNYVANGLLCHNKP